MIPYLLVNPSDERKPTFRSPLSRYLIAITIVGLACLLRLCIADIFGARLAYITFFPALMLTTWFFGFRAGLLSTGLSAVIVALWILPRAGVLIVDPVEGIGLAMFVCVGISMSVVGGLYHKAMAKVAAHEEVRASHLYELVAARTADLERSNLELREEIAYRKRAVDSAKQLAAIVESSEDAIIGKDLRGIVTSWNRGAAQIFGYAASEMVGRSILRLIPTDRQHEEAHILEKLGRGESIQHFDTRRLCRDGSTVEVSLTVSAIKNAAGTVVGASKVARDISERISAEAALRDSEERLRRATDAAELGIWAWQPSLGNIVWENQWPYAILGIPRREGPSNASRFAADFVSPDDLSAFELATTDTVRNGNRLFYQGQVKSPDGRLRWVEFTGMPVMGPDGTCLRVLGTVQDITARQLAAEALSKSEELLALAMKAGKLGVWDWDIVADTMVWDDECRRMTGLDSDTELTYAVAMGVVHPNDRVGVDAEVSRSLQARTDCEVEYRTVWPDGTVRWLNSRGRFTENAAGKSIRATGILLDVTERKESEEALRRFNAQLESLVRERTRLMEATMQDLQKEVAERQRLEEEILGIAERAQARIGQDLHDDLGQQLVGCSLLLQLISSQLTAELHPRAAEGERLKQFFAECISTTRNLAKSLYPVELESGGLMMALEELAARTEIMTGTICTLSGDDSFVFEKAAEIHLYRIVQEAIVNALKHGRARHIAIVCRACDGASTLTVTDDGTGANGTPDALVAGMGLHIFQYRARLINADISVSCKIDEGCELTCLLKNTR